MSIHALPRLALACLLLVTWPLATARAATLKLTVHDAAGAPIADAVAWLDPLDRPPPPAAGAARASIDQRNLSFTPQVLVVRTGTEVTFPNSDNVRHQVYSFSPAKRFELKLYAGNHASTERFDQAGIVTLGCNIHDWMLGFVVVLDTPWFAQSGADGAMALDGLPAGRYRLTVWHPQLAPGSAPPSETVTVDATTPPRDVALTLQPPEQTNQPPPGLEMGLGDRMQGHHAH